MESRTLFDDKSLHYSKIVDENEVGILNPANKITIEYNLEPNMDKASRMPNEHREGLDWLIQKQDESTIESETY